MLLLWVLRFGVFHLYESPKYLMGRGRDTDAVDIVHKVAAYNGTISGLTVEMLEEAGRLASLVDPTTGNMETSAKAAALRKLRKFNKGHVSSLFATKKLAYSTFLLIIIWGTLYWSSLACKILTIRSIDRPCVSSVSATHL